MLHRLACALSIVLFGFSAALPDLGAAESTSQQSTEPDAADSQFFETQIRPVLIGHCYSCHSVDAKSVRGGLLLDSREGMLRGGDSGPAVVPGDVENSLVVSALQFESFEMPPRGQLDQSITDDFAKWISRGAFDPRDESMAKPTRRIDPAAARDHWAFQPVHEPAVPNISDEEFADRKFSDWVQTPIDAFVIDALLQKGWGPAGKADKYTLIRRATFDLIGLPPTLEEVNAFIEDDMPGSFDRVVDRLLASPYYGQRWGRHWLDLVRYADTNGADENHTMPNAWRYRDWVFRAFNRDQPLDQFIVHQLAGDLLVSGADDEQTRQELLTATGMLVIGPKMLAEQDKEKMRIDIIDEQIDTVSRTMMGMTMACARCHDHKFDPISAEDYYALAGIFASTRTMLHEEHVSKWMERDLPSVEIDGQRKRHQSKIDTAKQSHQALIENANAAVLGKLGVTELPRKSDDHYPKETKSAIDGAKKHLETVEKAMPVYVSVMAVTEATPVDLAVHIRGNHLRPASETTARGAPKRITQVTPISPIADDASGRLELATWLTRSDHVLTGRVMTNRLWMWHFGKSLVASPSNFGLQCPRPAHAKLLDWMTRRLIDDGWSLKRMHRLIMRSSTYQMTSRDQTYLAEDPDNESLWRQNRRRLEVEPLRDAILDAGDALDRRLDGAPDGGQSNRQTVYLSINRAALLDLMSTFDYVEPANHIEQRSVTTVPSQALFLMNSSLVHNQADRLAQRLLDLKIDDDARLMRVWMKLHGRPPTARQRKLAIEFLDRATRQGTVKTAWASLCRTLIAGSQFSYVQ